MTPKSSGSSLGRKRGSTTKPREMPEKSSSSGSSEPAKSAASDKRERRSHDLSVEDWAAIDEVAGKVGAVYSGRPSWRRLLLMIARGEVKVRALTRPGGRGK